MPAIVTTNIRFLHADNFISSVKNVDQMLYMFIGKEGYDSEWVSGSPTPTNTYSRFLEDSADIDYMTRVYYSNLSRVMKHTEWVGDVPYAMYNDSSSIIGTNFFVVDNKNVYKCLDNNGGADSTERPTSVDTSGVESMSDKYVWKYMYTIPSEWGDQIVTGGGSADWIKIDNVSTREENTTQWDVRRNAKPGAIHAFRNIVDPLPAGFLLEGKAVTIVGDGDGEFVGKVISGKIVCDENIDSSIKTGSKYNTVTAVYVDGQELFDGNPRIDYITPIISPPGGHGFDPIRELDGYYVLIDLDFGVPDGVDTQYRKLGLIANPLRKIKSDGITNNHLSYVSSSDIVLGEKIGKKIVDAETDYLPYSGEIIYIENKDEIKNISSSGSNEVKLILSF